MEQVNSLKQQVKFRVVKSGDLQAGLLVCLALRGLCQFEQFYDGLYTMYVKTRW